MITLNNCHIGLLQKLVLIDADETLAADTESILIFSNKQSAAVSLVDFIWRQYCVNQY